MDDFVFWIVIICFIAVLSLKARTRINFTDAYRKKVSRFCLKVSVLILIVGGLMCYGLVLFLFEKAGWRIWILFVTGAIVFIIFFIPKFREDAKELKEMYHKQEQESIYQTELIKERARLHAREERRKK